VGWRAVLVGVAVGASLSGCSYPVPPPTKELSLPPAEPPEDCQSLARDPLPTCESLPDVPRGSSTASGWFALDSSNLYLAEGDGRIFVEPRSAYQSYRPSDTSYEIMGGAAATVAIAVDATNVYSTGEALVSVSKQGGPATTLFDGPTGALAVGEGFVYFTKRVLGAASELWRWSASGGAERVTALNSESVDESLLLADGFAYLLERSSQPGSIARVDTTSGELVVLVSGLDVSRGFAKSSGFLYFTEEDGHSVKRVAIDGGDSAVLATFLGYPQKIDTDGSRLYITLLDADPIAHAVSARLVRLAMDGSEACVLRCASAYSVPNSTYLVLNQGELFD
jgi:hypothetical protein